MHLKDQKVVTAAPLRVFFSKAVLCFQRCDEASARDVSSELQATKLVDATVMTWLADLVKKTLCPKMMESAEMLAKTALTTSALGAGLFGKMPAVINETDYRQYLSRHKKEMAAEGLKVQQAVAELDETLKALKEAGALCTAVSGDSFEYLENVKLFCKGLSQSITAHVTWYACLSLFRAPVTGGRTEGSKNNARQLVCLLVTMCGHMETTPLDAKLPVSLFRSLGSEMMEAVPSLT